MKLINEKDVEIDVKNDGILEVPEGKTVDQLPMSHFEKLAKKNGLGKITKALNNLQVWNKNDDPKLSKWAGNMIDKLNKKLKKDESYSPWDDLPEVEEFNNCIEYWVGCITDGTNLYIPRINGIEKGKELPDESDYFDGWLADMGSQWDRRDREELYDGVAYYLGYEGMKFINSIYNDIKSGKYNGYFYLCVKFSCYITLEGGFPETRYSPAEPPETVWNDEKFEIEEVKEITREKFENDISDPDYDLVLYNDGMSESLVKESPMDYLDTTTRDIVDKLEKVGYTGTRKPIMFGGKPMGYWSKTYFTDKKTSSGIQVYIDPFDGSVEVQEFEYDADTEDLTDICPVKVVKHSNDVLKIDRWAKSAKKGAYPLNYESLGYDRYDSNVEARFMDIGDNYSDMPDLYDLYAANKGLPVSEFIKDARNGGFSKAEIDAFLRDNNITGKVCEGCGKKNKKGTRKLNEKSNFDDVEKAIRYYYPKWSYGDISYNGIADELAGLGHSERFIDAVLDGITQLYDDQERYDYEHDYDESVNVKSNRYKGRL